MAFAASFTWFAVQTIETARAKRGWKCRDASAVNLTFSNRRGDVVGGKQRCKTQLQPLV
jgi:hypothetical protein